MRTLPAAELLEIWERGVQGDPLSRMLDLLAAAFPETGRDELAHEPIGARDARLLSLREALFGPAIMSMARCPECGERLDLKFMVDDVRVPPSVGRDGPLRLRIGSYGIVFRLPDTMDLATCAGMDIEEARARLLQRCLYEGRCDDEPISASEIPGEVAGHIIAAMAAADPQADLQIALICPACGHRWSIIFDIVSFLWSEIDAWAMRLLHDVHVLAHAYGWSEAAILLLSPQRRQIYLTMATG